MLVNKNGTIRRELDTDRFGEEVNQWITQGLSYATVESVSSGCYSMYLKLSPSISDAMLSRLFLEITKALASMESQAVAP